MRVRDLMHPLTTFDPNTWQWFVKFYIGQDWPIVKGPGIELECAGATREQAEEIAKKLNAP